MARSAEPGRKAAYSLDLRWRVVWQRIAFEHSFRQIADNLCIAHSTASLIFKRFEETGDVEPSNQPQRENQRCLDVHHEFFVVALVMETPSYYLGEICKAVEEVTGVHVSEATICRVLRKNGLTRKKIRLVAAQRSMDYRATYMATALSFPREAFVFVDETGSDARNYIRKFGYSLRGLRAESHCRLSRGHRISAIAAMDCTGIVELELINGSVDSDIFFDFIRGSLLPQLQPFDGTSPHSVVILDNCSIHHVESIHELFEASGVLLLFLPPYSPDLMPIEEAFSYVKSYLKGHDDCLQATPDPLPIIRAAFQSISPQQCQAWITHAGYSE